MHSDPDVPADEYLFVREALPVRVARRLALATVALVILGVMALAMTGCCSSPVERPAREAWPGVREDAQLGVLARMDPDFMAQRGGEALSTEAAKFRLERIDLFDQAVKQLAE